MEPPLMIVPFYSGRESHSSGKYYWDIRQHGHNPFVILQLTLEGEGRWERGGKISPVPAGTAFLAIVPEKARYYYPPEGKESWSFCWLNFFSPFSVRLWKEFRDRFGSVLPLPQGSPAATLLWQLFSLLEAKADPWTVSEAAYAFHLQWWRQLEQPQDRVRDPVTWMESYFRRHYRQPVTMKQLAEQLGLSREHLTRLFEERHQQGPSTFLRRLRADAAQEMLTSTQLPLSEIALRTGFSSVRQMKRAWKMSPL